MQIIHLSDLHFSANKENTLGFELVRKCLVALLRKLSGPTVLILGGDITFQGQKRGYDDAAAFFEQTISDTGLDRSNIILCPGNHDIMTTNPFSGFDAFSYSLRKDKLCTFSDSSCVALKIGDIDFVINNSSYHREHAFGLADLNAVESAILSCRDTSEGALRIAISHHHVMPIHTQDSSTTRNAYNFVNMLEQSGFRFLLHGHQHFSMTNRIGSTPLEVLGVRSFNFVRQGVANGLNCISLDGSNINVQSFGIVLDGIKSYKPEYTAIGSAQRSVI